MTGRIGSWERFVAGSYCWRKLYPNDTKTENKQDLGIYYRAMHVVLARYCYRKSSVRPSVCDVVFWTYMLS